MIEHIGIFNIQCENVRTNEFLKIRLFPYSLIDAAFYWYTKLAPNSIKDWDQKGQTFHNQFHNLLLKLKFTNVSHIVQKVEETTGQLLK